MKVEIREYIAALHRLLEIKEQRGWIELNFCTDSDWNTTIEVQAIVTSWGCHSTRKGICDLVDKEVEFLRTCEDVVRVFDFHRDCNCITFELLVNKQG